MADFEISIDNLTDSQSLTQAVKGAYYPGNQQIIKKTSYSEDSNNFNRNLISRDPVKVLQGDALYRNPGFALAGYEQNVKASLHTVISMGSDIDDSVQIPDPDDPTKFLTGSQARMEIARKSFMSTGFAPTGFEGAINSFIASTQSEITGTSGTSGANGQVETADGYVPHGTKGYEVSDDIPVYNMANRAIALESEMTEDEKRVFREKADDLLQKSNFKCSDSSMLTGGTLIDFSTNRFGQDLKNLNFPINMAGSYVERDGRFRYERVELEKSLLGTGKKLAYPAAALIELLSRVTDKVFIRGGFGLGRGIIGGNFTELTASNNYVTDHAFARAFDISQVGNVSLDTTPSAETYLQALDQLLSYISSLAQELHPDQIGISDQLRTQLGLKESGLEEADAIIRKKYPSLGKFVDFTSDSNHRDHIHISFGSKRAGAFLPPFDPSFNPATDLTGSTTPLDTSIGQSTSNPSTLLAKFKKSYKTNTAPFGEGSLSQMEVFYLLNSYGNFGDELSAIFAEVARRESRCNPWSTNDDGFLGLWQLGTRVNSGGLTRPILTVPTTETVDMWKMAYTPWNYFKLTTETADNWIRNLQQNDPSNNAGRAYFDSRAFIPLNQVAMLRAKFNRPDIENDKIEFIGNKNSQSVLYPWGDGFLEHGWISGLKYENIRTIYQQGTGKDPELIDAWILYFTNGDSKTRQIDPENNKPKLQNWVQDFKYYEINYL